MRLISLELKNFRQHLDSEITFADGVTGIIGPNGAGKTTILEAIAWALYGAPAVRGTNDTIRSSASQGGSRASVVLAFELAGQSYRVTRSLDGSGRSGQAVLEVDGRPLKSGMSEVSDAVARLLGMDYRAFFTSFFTGQKQLEFMAQMDGKQRAAAISRMLGYDRLTKARDQATEDRRGLQREIEGLEKGLSDPEDLKLRKSDAESRLGVAKTALEKSEAAWKSARDKVERLKPVKELSDQKAKRRDELSRRLEIDRSEVERSEARLAQLRAELADLSAKQGELDALKPDLERFEEARKEYRQLAELQKHEGERQRLAGEIHALEQDVNGLKSRAVELMEAEPNQLRLAGVLAEAEKALQEIDRRIQFYREQKVAHEHSIRAQIKQEEWNLQAISEKRARIAEAGADGKCPTCERPLGSELATVLANFDRQLSETDAKIENLRQSTECIEATEAKLKTLQADRELAAARVAKACEEKSAVDALVTERTAALRDAQRKTSLIEAAQKQLERIPGGFDQNRFRELQKIGEELRPVREKAVALRSALERRPAVETELAELSAVVERKRTEVQSAENALAELGFSSEEHDRVTREFEEASASFAAASLDVERQRGEVNTATAVLAEVKREEESYKSRVEALKAKQSERLHLQTLSEAFDKLRQELNDRIRPELEAIAGDLLATMTDGRYTSLQINDNYQAMIRDDGELKPVISGGEEDVVNLSLRLAISQMIADRAGQPFSLLVLDEVFGSLDDSRRDNVVALLQNLKNRFEQIILITHVESIHDAVDNCLWVEFDERTKTSRLSDRANVLGESVAGLLS
jgi:exonuclease SbcC